MVVAAGPPDVGAHPSPVRLNLALTALVLVLACACVAGGVLVRHARDVERGDRVEQERYGAVLAAARAEAEAFVNIRYDDARSSIDKVASGATGSLRKQYDTSSSGVIDVLRQNRSVLDGKVLWAGVVDVDQDSATVIATTSGTVANVRTKNRPVARNFRLRLELVRSGGRWLTSDLESVG